MVGGGGGGEGGGGGGWGTVEPATRTEIKEGGLSESALSSRHPRKAEVDVSRVSRVNDVADVSRV